MARGRNFPARKRSVAWSVGPGEVDGSGGATGKFLWSQFIVGIGTALERTIVRIRGGGAFNLLSGTAAGDGFRVALGIGLVTVQAQAAGAALIPGPLTDADWDGWMWHRLFTVQVLTATFSDGVNAVSSAYHYEIDTKAMRKWHEDSVVIVGMSEVVELGASTFNHNATSRMLLKQG